MLPPQATRDKALFAGAENASNTTYRIKNVLRLPQIALIPMPFSSELEQDRQGLLVAIIS